MRQKLVVANWKMHGSIASVGQLLDGILRELPSSTAEVAVCPSFVHLGQALSRCADAPISVGAQDCSAQQQGAFTGQVAADMLQDIGCKWVLLGHSERREYCAESDALVGEKLRAAVAAGLQPILCVGESLAQREGGSEEQIVAQQLQAALADCDDLGSVVIAYEPVWAIGTGLTASPEQAQSMHAYIRRWLTARAPQYSEQMQLLYGGSVKGGNAAELFAQQDIDGALVGGAALKADEFLAIVRAAS